MANIDVFWCLLWQTCEGMCCFLCNWNTNNKPQQNQTVTKTQAQPNLLRWPWALVLAQLHIFSSFQPWRFLWPGITNVILCSFCVGVYKTCYLKNQTSYCLTLCNFHLITRLRFLSDVDTASEIMVIAGLFGLMMLQVRGRQTTFVFQTHLHLQTADWTCSIRFWQVNNIIDTCGFWIA